MSVDPEFTSCGFALLRGILSPELRSFAKECMDLSYRAGRMRPCADPGAYGQYEEYAPLFTEALLERLLPTVKSNIGDALSPTYSFWRLYQRGASLARHMDRPSCEISLSINIGVEPTEFVWPLRVQDLRGNEVSLPLLPGDGALYRGCDLRHWRDAFEGEVQYQMFLHYVRAEGPNAALKFDGRRSLAVPYAQRASTIPAGYGVQTVRCIQVSPVAPAGDERSRR